MNEKLIIYRRSGFTIIEMLIAILLIVALISLLLPAIQSSRRAARESHCLSNLRIGAANMFVYSNQNRGILWRFSSERNAPYDTELLANERWTSKEMTWAENTDIYTQRQRFTRLVCPERASLSNGGLSYFINAIYMHPDDVSEFNTRYELRLHNIKRVSDSVMLVEVYECAERQPNEIIKTEGNPSLSQNLSPCSAAAIGHRAIYWETQIPNPRHPRIQSMQSRLRESETIELDVHGKNRSNAAAFDGSVRSHAFRKVDWQVFDIGAPLGRGFSYFRVID